MSDNGIGIILILVQEISHARKSNLVDVFVYFFCSHTQTVVADGDGLVVLIEHNPHCQVAQFSFELSLVCKCFQLLCGVNGVAHHFTQKDFMVRIKKLFDDGKNVFRSHSNVAFLYHNASVVIIFI